MKYIYTQIKFFSNNFLTLNIRDKSPELELKNKNTSVSKFEFSNITVVSLIILFLGLNLMSESVYSQGPCNLAATVTKTNVTCSSLNNGTITLTSPTGGSGSFQYRLNIGGWQSSNVFAGLAPGSYLVQIRDANNITCFNELGTEVVTQPASLIANGIVTNVTCTGNNDGSISQTVSGGTGGYSYAWSDGGATTKDRTMLNAGIYTVTITDGNSCSINRTYNVVQSTALNLSADVTQPQCGVAGSIILTVSGGTSPYTSDWADIVGSDDPQNRSNLSFGTYSVTVSDQNGCSSSGSFNLIDPNCGPGEVVCIGGNNAAVYSVSPDPFVVSYNWTVSNGGVIVSGQGTPEIVVNWTGATPGEGQICVSTENDCGESVETCKNIILKLVDAFASAQPACTGDNLQLLAEGGAAQDDTYSWSGPNGFISNLQNPVINNVTTLNSGTYVVTVTDGDGCSGIASVSVTVAAGFTLSADIFDSACGQNIGTIDVTVTGGTAPINYIWSNGATTQDITDLPGGNYSLTVTDGDLCEGTFMGSVADSEGPVLSAVATNVTCNGGSDGTVTVTVSGGAPPITYIWSNGATTQNLVNVSAGIYNIVAIDTNGCVGTASGFVNQPNPFQVNISRTNLSCNGSNDGSISLNVIGGTPGYTYAWSDSGPATASRTGLSAGPYSVTITDALLCTTVRTIFITQPTAILGSLVTQDVQCSGQSDGIVNLSVSGGSSPYTYLWSNGATTKDLSGLSAGTYTVTVTDFRDCSLILTGTVVAPAPLSLTGTKVNVLCQGGSSGSIDLSVSGGNGGYVYQWTNGVTTQDISGLKAGIYTVFVIDNKGCSAAFTETITEPTALSVSVLVNDVLCKGLNTGSINVNVSGGTGSYIFTWSDGGSTTSFRDNLSAGIYAVTVTDDNGCTVSESSTIKEPLSFLSVSPVVRNVNCFGGSDGQVILTVSGGTSDYTYSWTGPSGFTAVTKDIMGRTPGLYNVTVTDVNGCTVGLTNIEITQPALLAVTSVLVSDVSCFGGSDGSIDVSISGGTTPYSIVWSNGATTEDITGLRSGTYNVIVIDSLGCTATGTGTVAQPTSPLTLNMVVNDILCNGDLTGSVNVNVSGGTGGYSFAWSDGGAAVAFRNNLAAGNYTVTVTDANSCTAVKQVTINENELITIEGVAKDVLCNGGTDGSILLTLNGGEGAYSIVWSNGLPAQTQQTGLSIGTYSVTVTDALGCIATSSYTITQPAVLSATGVTSPALCFESEDGSVNLSVTGGVSPYTYQWSSGVNTEDASSLSAGSYTVTVTDANLCSTTASFTISEPTPIAISSIVVPNCENQTNGSVALSVSGGTPNYSYMWSGAGSGNNPRTGMSAGVYFVTVTDAQQCEAVDSFELIPFMLEVTGIDRTCSLANGRAFASASGGLEPYSYSWSNGGSTEFIENLDAGTYSVTVTSGACTQIRSIVITIPDNCEPPVAQDDFYTTPINTPLTGTVMPTDSLNPGYDFDPFYPLEDLTFEDVEGLDTLIGTMVWDSLGGFVFTPREGYTGTFSLVYELCNPLDLCDRATLTITVLGPDVTPVVTAFPNVMQGITDFNLIVRVTELNNVSTNGLITVKIPKDVRLTFKSPYNPALTQLGTVNLNNSEWSYSQDANFHIFTSSTVIVGGGFSTFGFVARFDPSNAKGFYTLTAQIEGGSGGEIRIDNNVDSEKLDYFIE